MDGNISDDWMSADMFWISHVAASVPAWTTLLEFDLCRRDLQNSRDIYLKNGMSIRAKSPRWWRR
jgi:hypothetical protein